MMPEKDGIETCQELRKVKELQKHLLFSFLQEAKNFPN
jgi:two-component system alkaline phosphatase synthesis response regulator PhoP